MISPPPTYINWMLIQFMAKYGHKIQLYGGLGTRHSTPMRFVCCVVCSVVELCGLSVLHSSGQCINRVVRFVVWGVVGV